MDILARNRLASGQMEHSAVQRGLPPNDPRSLQQQRFNRVFKGREDRGRFAWLEVEPLYFSIYWVVIIAPPTSQAGEYVWKTWTPVWHLASALYLFAVVTFHDTHVMYACTYVCSMSWHNSMLGCYLFIFNKNLLR